MTKVECDRESVVTSLAEVIRSRPQLEAQRARRDAWTLAGVALIEVGNEFR
jgi:hypothetical protein